MSAKSRVFNLIASQLEEEPLPTTGAIEYAPVAVRSPPLPTYVNHMEGVPEVGKLSAQAVALEYEHAAREIEQVGRELAKRGEEITTAVHDTVAEITAVAAKYRQEGKRLFEQIESCTAMTDQARELCGTLAQKISTAKMV